MESRIVHVLLIIIIMAAIYFIGRLAINVLDGIFKKNNKPY